MGKGTKGTAGGNAGGNVTSTALETATDEQLRAELDKRLRAKRIEANKQRRAMHLAAVGLQRAFS